MPVLYNSKQKHIHIFLSLKYERAFLVTVLKDKCQENIVRLK